MENLFHEKIKMIKIEKIYPRDIIAFAVLLFSMILIGKGINSLVSGIVIMIVTFYFAGRLSGNGEPKRDLHERMKKVELDVESLPGQIRKAKVYGPGTEPLEQLKYDYRLRHDSKP